MRRARRVEVWKRGREGESTEEEKGRKAEDKKVVISEDDKGESGCVHCIGQVRV